MALTLGSMRPAAYTGTPSNAVATTRPGQHAPGSHDDDRRHQATESGSDRIVELAALRDELRSLDRRARHSIPADTTRGSSVTSSMEVPDRRLARARRRPYQDDDALAAGAAFTI